MSFFGTGHPLGRHLFVNKMLIAQENFLINFTDVVSIIMAIVMFKGVTLHDNTERGCWSSWPVLDFFSSKTYEFEDRMTRCWSICLFDP